MRLKFSTIAVSGALALLAQTAGAASAAFPTLQGPQSSASSYLVPVAPGAAFASILTTGDASPAGYRMAGIPDGLGAIDNGSTITVFMNHEIAPPAGVGRSHNPTGNGSFVSAWTIRKSDLAVVHGADQVRSVMSWDKTAGSFFLNSAATFNRLCSADLPTLTAFYNPISGNGFNGRIFMNGEESGNEGKAYGHIVSGVSNGVSYELPSLGRFSWENSVAHYKQQDKTIVVGLDDSSPGQVYVYVGNKQSTGNAVEMAGLHGGNLYGIKVAGTAGETRGAPIANGTSFTMHSFGDVRNTTGAQLQADSNAAGVTNFLRPEDGQWNPANDKEFYFVTTDALTASGGRSRLYRLTFTDAANPEFGGKIDTLLLGTEGYEMLDNMTISADGKRVILQEDPGGNARSSRIWEYNLVDGKLTEIGKHDPARFGEGALLPTAPFNNNEESSGVIDVTEMLTGVTGYDTTKYRYYLLDVQAHYALGKDLVEGGQLGIMAVPVPEPESYAMMGVGLGLVAFAIRRRQRKQHRLLLA